MKVLLSTHNDDSVLFASHLLLREKPLVIAITDAHIQHNRGEKNCDAETRWNEDVKAMEIMGCPIIRLGIKDFELVKGNLINFFLFTMKGFDTVYAPAIQDGNPHHDIVGEAAQVAFGDKVVFYSGYKKGEWFSEGNKEIELTVEELSIKSKALDCYQSQINLPATRGHFDASRASKSEWLVV